MRLTLYNPGSIVTKYIRAACLALCYCSPLIQLVHNRKALDRSRRELDSRTTSPANPRRSAAWPKLVRITYKTRIRRSAHSIHAWILPTPRGNSCQDLTHWVQPSVPSTSSIVLHMCSRCPVDTATIRKARGRRGRFKEWAHSPHGDTRSTNIDEWVAPTLWTLFSVRLSQIEVKPRHVTRIRFHGGCRNLRCVPAKMIRIPNRWLIYRS